MSSSEEGERSEAEEEYGTTKKRGRGRPAASKKAQTPITDLPFTEAVIELEKVQRGMSYIIYAKCQ